MARIQLHNVSLIYPTPLREASRRLFVVKKDRLQEDLPVGTGVGVRALDGVNLSVPNGQTFVILGPSGCGKSALLRVVAGIEKNYRGQVLYDGEDVQDVPPGDRYIGMVFQNYALYPNFSGEGNLSFFFKMHQISDEENARAHPLHVGGDGNRIRRIAAAQTGHALWRRTATCGARTCHCPCAAALPP